MFGMRGALPILRAREDGGPEQYAHWETATGAGFRACGRIDHWPIPTRHRFPARIVSAPPLLLKRMAAADRPEAKPH